MSQHHNPNMSLDQQRYALRSMEDHYQGHRNRMQSWLLSCYRLRVEGEVEQAENHLVHATECALEAERCQEVMVAFRRSIRLMEGEHA